METRFRPVAHEEFDGALKVYLEVFEWLNAKGIRQWLHPLSRQTFAERQHRGELLAHFAGDLPVSIVTLAFEVNSDWPEKIAEGRRWWIKSLAVSRRYSGAGIGVRVMENCEALIQNAGADEAFLDCVDAGFLPGYYASLGYEELGRKDITYPSGNKFPMVLMRKKLNRGRNERSQTPGFTPHA